MKVAPSAVSNQLTIQLSTMLVELAGWWIATTPDQQVA